MERKLKSSKHLSNFSQFGEEVRKSSRKKVIEVENDAQSYDIVSNSNCSEDDVFASNYDMSSDEEQKYEMLGMPEPSKNRKKKTKISN